MEPPSFNYCANIFPLPSHAESNSSILNSTNFKKYEKCVLRDSKPHLFTSLLLSSAANESINLLHELIQMGESINITDEYGHTALHLAIIQDRCRAIQKQNRVRNLTTVESIVRLLLKKGAHVDAKTSNGLTALHLAVNLGYSNIVCALLEHGADVHVVVEEYIRHAVTRECFSMSDQISMLTSMKEMPVKEYGHSSKSSTILHIAVRHRFVKIVKMLLKAGANVNSVQFDGKTPLFVAAGTNCNKTEEVVGLLLQQGSDVNLKIVEGMTSLHVAAKNGNIKVVKTLLAKGAFVDSRQNNGKTPLALAVEEEKDEVVEFFLQSGADVDQKDNNGWTPLHTACNKTNEKIVSLLLKAGADVNVTCNNGKIPYELALATERRYWKWKQDTLKLKHHQNCCLPAGPTYWCDLDYFKVKYVLQILQGHFNMMYHFGLELHPCIVSGKDSEYYLPEDMIKSAVEKFKMKTLTSCGDVTIRKVLDDHHDPVYVFNENLMEELISKVTELEDEMSAFIEMSSVISYILRKAKLKAKLLNIGQDWLASLLFNTNSKLPVLPKEITRKILAYLNECELKLAMGIR